MKIQEQVLHELFFSGKECSVQYLSKNIGIKPFQVYNAIYHLIRRGLIEKKRILKECAGYRNSPIQILVKVDDRTAFKCWRISKIIKQIEAEARGK